MKRQGEGEREGGRKGKEGKERGRKRRRGEGREGEGKEGKEREKEGKEGPALFANCASTRGRDRGKERGSKGNRERVIQRSERSRGKEGRSGV